MKIFNIDRTRYTKDTTIGDLFLPDGKWFSYTLEDIVRAWGIKANGATAIPATTDILYKMEVTFSQRFQKELPVIYTHIIDGKYILRNGIEFEVIRMHGGTTIENTDGCIITAYNYDGKDKIWDNASDELTRLIKNILKTDTAGLRIRNLRNTLV